MTVNKLSAVIIDDELAARETLRHYCTKYCPQIELLGEAHDVPSGVELIQNAKPQLVFLDVEMPFGNAFDVLEQTSNVEFYTIFITAFSEYAIQALNFSAAYYILKPVDIEELIRAVEKVSEQDLEQKTAQIAVLQNNLKHPTQRKIVLPTTFGFEVINVNEIVRLSGSSNYTEVFLTDGKKKVVSRVLKHFQEILEDQGFMRIHKSHLIGLDHIVSYQRGRGGSVVMSDGAEIEVSPTKKEELLAYFNR